MISNGEIATLAQLVEHSPCKRTVVSSSLTGGSISIFLAFIVFLQLFAHTLLSAKEDGELKQTAEIVLLYQRSSGGWPKGYDRNEKLSTERKKIVLGWRQKKEATIDNGACSPRHSRNLGTNDSRKRLSGESSTCSMPNTKTVVGPRNSPTRPVTINTSPLTTEP